MGENTGFKKEKTSLKLQKYHKVSLQKKHQICIACHVETSHSKYTEYESMKSINVDNEDCNYVLVNLFLLSRYHKTSLQLRGVTISWTECRVGLIICSEIEQNRIEKKMLLTVLSAFVWTNLWLSMWKQWQRC